MAFAIAYNKLFEVKIIHHYFLDNGAMRYDDLPPERKAAAAKAYEVSSFLKISPTQACRQRLKNWGCIFRQTTDGFIVLARMQQKDGKPLPVNVPAMGNLTFMLTLTDPYFKNYTSLPLKDVPGDICFFTNRNKDTTQVAPSLTRIAALKEAGKKYNAGDILTDANETVIAGKLAADTLVQDFVTEPHIAGRPPQFVTARDTIRLTAGLIAFTSKKTQAELQSILKLENSSGELIIPRQTFTAVTEGVEKTAVQIDLSQLPEDVYALTSDTGISQWFYNKEQTAFNGIIHIAVKADANGYSLLDAQGFAMQPVFEIRYKNRFTAWRYMGPALAAPVDTDYKPMTAKGKIAVSVVDKNGKTIAGIPNAGIAMIKPEPVLKNSEVFIDENNNTFYNVYSDIYIT